MKRDSRRLQYQIAREAFFELINFSISEAKKGNISIASEVGKLAFKVARKNRLKIPLEVKRAFCRRCYVPLIPGLTAKVRIRRKGELVKVVSCLNCGYVRRYPVKRDEGERPSPNQAHGLHRQKRINGKRNRGDKEAT